MESGHSTLGRLHPGYAVTSCSNETSARLRFAFLPLFPFGAGSKQPAANHWSSASWIVPRRRNMESVMAMRWWVSCRRQKQRSVLYRAKKERCQEQLLTGQSYSHTEERRGRALLILTASFAGLARFPCHAPLSKDEQIGLTSHDIS